MSLIVMVLAPGETYKVIKIELPPEVCDISNGIEMWVGLTVRVYCGTGIDTTYIFAVIKMLKWTFLGRMLHSKQMELKDSACITNISLLWDIPARPVDDVNDASKCADNVFVPPDTAVIYVFI